MTSKRRTPRIAPPTTEQITDDELLQLAKDRIEQVFISLKAEYGKTIELRPNVPRIYFTLLQEAGIIQAQSISITLVVVESNDTA